MSDPTRRCRCRECEKDARAAPPATEDRPLGLCDGGLGCRHHHRAAVLDEIREVLTKAGVPLTDAESDLVRAVRSLAAAPLPGDAPSTLPISDAEDDGIEVEAPTGDTATPDAQGRRDVRDDPNGNEITRESIEEDDSHETCACGAGPCYAAPGHCYSGCLIGGEWKWWPLARAAGLSSGPGATKGESTDG